MENTTNQEEMRREDQVNAEFNTDSLGAVREMESIDSCKVSKTRKGKGSA